MEHKMFWCDAPDDAGYVHRIAIRLAFAGMGLGRHPLQVVLVPKGRKLMLVDDDATEHIIQIGSWTSSGMPELQVEPGAPVVRALSLKNGSAEIGPFSTAGVFHLYCTIHQQVPDREVTLVSSDQHGTRIISVPILGGLHHAYRRAA